MTEYNLFVGSLRLNQKCHLQLFDIFLKLLLLHFRYDIALLKLSSDAILGSYVQLAALPPSGQILPHDNFCYITGWGRTSSTSVTVYLDLAGSDLLITLPLLFPLKLNALFRFSLTQLVAACLKSSNRPTFQWWTTRPAPAATGGAAL